MRQTNSRIEHETRRGSPWFLSLGMVHIEPSVPPGDCDVSLERLTGKRALTSAAREDRRERSKGKASTAANPLWTSRSLGLPAAGHRGWAPRGHHVGTVLRPHPPRRPPPPELTGLGSVSAGLPGAQRWSDSDPARWWPPFRGPPQLLCEVGAKCAFSMAALPARSPTRCKSFRSVGRKP